MIPKVQNDNNAIASLSNTGLNKVLFRNIGKVLTYARAEGAAFEYGNDKLLIIKKTKLDRPVLNIFLNYMQAPGFANQHFLLGGPFSLPLKHQKNAEGDFGKALKKKNRE